MFQIVHIGEKEVPMLSLASVDNYFMQIFGKDPVRIQDTAGDDTAAIIDLFERMGFVMHKYAELKDRKEMLKLNEEAYLDWLDQFERLDMYNALPDIRKVYEGQKISNVSPKKKEDR